MPHHSSILCDHLTKTFSRGKSQIHAVRNLNLEVRPGQVYGFLGPNGAGRIS